MPVIEWHRTMAKEGKRRIGKVLLIAGLVFLLLYPIGGTVAGIVVSNVVFSGRSSTAEDLALAKNRIYKLREDYPNLAERTVHSFPSGDNTLSGYLYSQPSSKGVVIFAHGMGSQADGPEAALQSYYVGKGYDVFAFDITASGRSGGKDKVSLVQSAHDFAAAYKHLYVGGYLHGEVISSGYSWGAYGAARSLALGAKADKVIAFAGYASAYEGMVSTAAGVAGPIAYATVPPFALGTLMVHGKEAFDSAVDAIIAANVPTFLMQGSKDERFPLGSSASLLSRLMERENCVDYVSDAPHKYPWFSSDARKYVSEQLMPKVNELQNASKKEIDSFIATVDKEKSSALDAALVESLNRFLGE